jgi:hypothetical protein
VFITDAPDVSGSGFISKAENISGEKEIDVVGVVKATI